MDQSLVLILSLVIVALVLLLIGIIALYFRLFSQFEVLKHGKEMNVDPKTLIDQARARSQQILEEAHTQKNQIISQAQSYLAREEGVLAKEIEKAQTGYQKSYDNAISMTQNKALQMIQNIPQDIKMTLISVIDNFRVSLTKEITKSQEEANKSIREAYQQASEEVNKYKEDRMKQVDQAILDIVKEVTEKVLAKSISTEEHEKLVEKALEEAKRQRIF